MLTPQIELLLPEVLRRTCVPGTPMAALLAVMEAHHDPAEAILANLAEFFDPLQTPDRFVPMLARWVDLDRLNSDGGIEVGRMRLLVSMAAVIARRRGTRAGLLQVLQIATGVAGIEVDEAVPDEDGAPRPFHIRVLLPAGADSMITVVETIVEQEKPAHITAEVAVAASAPVAA
jgi:phage tail-like protein